MERIDWVWASLGDIATISSGNTPKGINDIEFNPEFKIPFYKISDMNTEGNEGLMSSSNIVVSNDLVKKLKLRLEPGGTIIFPKRGGAILTNKKRRLSKESAYDLNIMGVKEKNKSIFNDYLWYWFVKLDLAKLYDGSNVPQINNKDIEPLGFPIAPLPEQRAIVAKIEQLFSELDNGIDNLKKVQEQLKVYRQAVLKKAFEGELTKAWRAKQTDLPTAEELLDQIKMEREAFYQQQLETWKLEVKEWEANGKEGKKPTKSKKLKELPPLNKEELADLPELPKGWRWVRLGSLTESVFDGPFGANLKTSDYVDRGIRVVRLENIKNLWFDNSKESFISQEKYVQLRKHTVYPKDIIFSSFIAEETKVVAIPPQLKFAVNKADCFCIRTLESVYYKFLESFLSTRQTYSQLINEVHGATRPRINTTQLKNIGVPLFSSAEQRQLIQEIESRLSVCDKVEEAIKESLGKAEALRQSILKKAFEGKLLSEAELESCRKEPDWEPAEKLLERIKAEKGKADKVKKKEVLA